MPPARGLMLLYSASEVLPVSAACSENVPTVSCRRFRISMRISSGSVMCPRPPTAHPPRFRAWSSFSRDRVVALTRLPKCSFDEPPIQVDSTTRDQVYPEREVHVRANTFTPWTRFLPRTLAQSLPSPPSPPPPQPPPLSSPLPPPPPLIPRPLAPGYPLGVQYDALSPSCLSTSVRQ